MKTENKDCTLIYENTRDKILICRKEDLPTQDKPKLEINSE